mmetsp:Transcript_19583/g.25258  ORF Transcript_19583/g.25258 Transcript_19583/m.25258 type:complete len:84 (+) Transcript_19583:35-286(+)
MMMDDNNFLVRNLCRKLRAITKTRKILKNIYEDSAFGKLPPRILILYDVSISQYLYSNSIKSERKELRNCYYSRFSSFQIFFC